MEVNFEKLVGATAAILTLAGGGAVWLSRSIIKSFKEEGLDVQQINETHKSLLQSAKYIEQNQKSMKVLIDDLHRWHNVFEEGTTTPVWHNSKQNTSAFVGIQQSLAAMQVNLQAVTKLLERFEMHDMINDIKKAHDQIARNLK